MHGPLFGNYSKAKQYICGVFFLEIAIFWLETIWAMHYLTRRKCLILIMFGRCIFNLASDCLDWFTRASAALVLESCECIG